MYQQKQDDESWSTDKLRSCLRNIAKTEEEGARTQTCNASGFEKRPVYSKTNRQLRETESGESSALAVANWQGKNDDVPKEIEKRNPNRNSVKRKPCSFCNKDHWDDDCRVYPTAKQRMERSQLPFISTKLANQLKLQETKNEELSVASFGNKIPKKCYSKMAEIGVKIVTENVITYKINFMEYLTNK
ncbi:unnamed protein product, partial [Onchocerca ochengi]|uniref:Uncharacterized protein n=1 Tax=Onchocerca ochengi TaxID=42157 RepID=A0A182EMD2_ONCOC